MKESSAAVADAHGSPSATRTGRWLATRQARMVLLAFLGFLALPVHFVEVQYLGLDPSWKLSLQLAAIQHKIFGQDFVFTYGPLGYLFIRADVNKAGLLLFDFFVIGSLLSIFNRLIPARPRLLDILPLIGVAVVIKINTDEPGALAVVPAVVFAILCYWLWRVYDWGDNLAVAGGLIAAVALFFGKVNYGTIMLLLVPAYGIGLLLLQRQRRVQGLMLLFGFPLLVWLGAKVWNVDLPRYLHSGVELIDGYSEAMVMYPPLAPLVFKLAWVFLAGMAVIALAGWGRLSWRGQVMILPLIGVAALLLYKNAFVRADGGHTDSFFLALPLLLAVWLISWRGAETLQVLLVASLFYPLAQLLSDREIYTGPYLVQSLPLSYIREAVFFPWRENQSFLEQRLRATHPEGILPVGVRSYLGGSSVDVMPWESSIAILNGLNYRPRPIPQSYSAYTPWLDELNARFLDSTNAPDCILYACGDANAIDARPGAWDESITKMSLLENYKFVDGFKLPLRVWPFSRPADVFIMKHMPGLRRLVPVTTNEVSLTPGQVLPIPSTTNLVFLTLEVHRSPLGKLRAAILSPNILTVTFEYEDGGSKTFRAVLPVLRTGVLVNRKVETAVETRNWLQGEVGRNLGVNSIYFNTSKPWTFRSPFTGTLVEYAIVEK